MKWNYLWVAGIKQNAWLICSKSKSAAKWTISYQLSLCCQFFLTIAPAETKMGLGQNVSLYLLQLWMSLNHIIPSGAAAEVGFSSPWHLFSRVRPWDQLGAALKILFSHLCTSATADRKHVKGIFEVFSSLTEVLLIVLSASFWGCF